MCVGAEAKDCHLSGYTHIYGHTGDSPVLECTSIKSRYIIDMIPQIIYVI